jgi:DhnA family fructose-bisphosphate aldolase class Ia
MAVDLGADMIKMMCPPDPLEMAAVVASCPVPVVGLGGPKIESEDEIVELARAVTKSGAAGMADSSGCRNGCDRGRSLR